MKHLSGCYLTANGRCELGAGTERRARPTRRGAIAGTMTSDHSREPSDTQTYFANLRLRLSRASSLSRDKRPKSIGFSSFRSLGLDLHDASYRYSIMCLPTDTAAQGQRLCPLTCSFPALPGTWRVLRTRREGAEEGVRGRGADGCALACLRAYRVMPCLPTRRT